MPGLFTPKQVEAYRRGLAECEACGELIQVREQMGLDSSAKAAENDTIKKVIQAALTLHDTYTPPPKQGG